MSDEPVDKHPVSPLGLRVGRMYDALPDQVLKLKLLRFLEQLAKPGTVNPRRLVDDQRTALDRLSVATGEPVEKP